MGSEKMEKGKIVYLSGNLESKNDFNCAENFLLQMGYIVLNPTQLEDITEGLSAEKLMKISYQLIDIADIIFMVSGWQKSKGANAELSYAKSLGKKVMYQDYYAPFRKVNEE